MKKIVFISILIFLIGCASQHKIGKSEVDKYIHFAEENLKNGKLDLASENLKKALDFSLTSEQKDEIDILLNKIIEARSELEAKKSETKKKEKGVEEKEEAKKEEKKAKDLIVYVTKTGKKYHQSWCSYLRKSAISKSLKNAKARGYTPCSKCNPQR